MNGPSFRNRRLRIFPAPHGGAQPLFGVSSEYREEVALMKLSEKILYYRKAAKLSQEELA